MVRAYTNGIKVPYQAMKASDATGVPFHVLCAFLEQESSGGENVFGHDPTIFAGAGRVTKKKYLAYKKQRDADLTHRKMQGVGPMQLTWYEFQDRADLLGGCWRPYINILVGAQLLKEYKDSGKTWAEVATRYNGSSDYGKEVAYKITKWKSKLS